MRIPEIRDCCLILYGEHKGRIGRVVSKGTIAGFDAVTLQMRDEGQARPGGFADVSVGQFQVVPDPTVEPIEATIDGKPSSEFMAEARVVAPAATPAPVAPDPVAALPPLPLPPLPPITNPAIVHDEESEATPPHALCPLYCRLRKGRATSNELAAVNKDWQIKIKELRAWLEENAGKTIRKDRPRKGKPVVYRIERLDAKE